MVTGHVYIASSLDGFIAREDHSLEWLNKQSTEGEEHGYYEFVDTIDGIVMGRGSFQTCLTFDAWPYTKPVVVLSRTLGPDDVPSDLEGRVRILDMEPVALMRQLAEEGWKRAYVDGGAVVQSFVRLGLVEDFVVTLIPILLGGGIRLFGPMDEEVDLELQGVTAFPSGLVQTRYRVARSND